MGLIYLIVLSSALKFTIINHLQSVWSKQQLRTLFVGINVYIMFDLRIWKLLDVYFCLIKGGGNTKPAPQQIHVLFCLWLLLILHAEGRSMFFIPHVFASEHGEVVGVGPPGVNLPSRQLAENQH